MKADPAPGALYAVPESRARGEAVEPLELTLHLSAAQVAQLAAAVLALLEERFAGRIARAEPPPDDARWWSVAEVARRVDVSRRTVYRALASGALAGEHVGSRWRIRPTAVT